MQADGSAPRRLTVDTADEDYPSWSPDGLTLAFMSDRDGDCDIYTMNADGSGVTLLTQNPMDDLRPVWSPVGAEIAFVAQRPGGSAISVVNADGSGLADITDASSLNADPAWSPGGRQIAFLSNRRGAWDLYVMDIDGGHVAQLTNDAAIEYSVSWSPAGVTLGDQPYFGPPWCARDADGDGSPDTPTTTFSTGDLFAYVVFPYRNMRDGMLFSHQWVMEASELDVAFMSFWDGGEEGFHTSYSSAPTSGAGDLTIRLSLEGQLMQEIQCEVTED
jgi:Tol biopolymer transport system component